MIGYLSLSTQYENLGDEVINAVLVRQLARRMQVNALALGVPSWYIANLKGHLAEFVDKLHIFENRNAFAKDLIKAGFAGPPSYFFTSCGDVSSSRSNYSWDGAMLALQSLPNMRLGVVGASYGQIAPSKKVLLKAAVRKAPTISTRDSLSLRILRDAGVESEIVPDLAFGLPFSRNEASRDLALLSFRAREHQDETRIVAGLRSFVDHSVAMGLRPTTTWQVDRDESYCRHLAGVLGIECVPAFREREDRFGQAASLYDRAAIMASNRLHALLIAASRGVMPIAVLGASELKIRGIFTDEGLEGLIVPRESAETFDWRGFIQNRDVWLTMILRAFATNGALIEAYFDRLLALPERR